jgi:phosphate-selective porin OprO/OprP
MGLRRARLRMGGLAFEQIEYFAQYEFANALDLRQRTLGIPNPAGIASPNITNIDPNETVGFNEVYIGLVKLPHVGNVRVGRHRESLNFVTATADNYQIWLERGLLFDAFNGSYNFSNGVTVSRTYLDDRAYTLFGFFQQNNNNNRQFASVGDGDYVYDGRVTFLPCWDEEDQFWVHVGADYSYRNLFQDNVRYRGRPNIRVGSSFQVPNIVDTGAVFSADAQQIVNLEFAAARGPWTVAAEATTSWVTNAYTGGLPLPDGTLPSGVVSRGTYRASGAYVEVMRFLTADHRPYVKERPGYGRVTPNNTFFLLRGDNDKTVFNCGAWEIGVRYDYIDLTHGGINGGVAQGVSAAVNWYLSSNTRVQANYIWMHRDFQPPDRNGRVSGDFSGFGLRFNCDF